MTTRSRKVDSKVAGNKPKGGFPPFMKPYIPETRGKILRFPPTYTKYVEGRLPEQALLKDRYGNVWNVEIGRLGDQICIVDGWLTFVLQNFLEWGDMVVFRYDGEKVFYVTILGGNCKEKMGVGRFKYDGIKEEEEEEESDDGDEEREYGRRENKPSRILRSSTHSKSHHKQTRNFAGLDACNKNKSRRLYNNNFKDKDIIMKFRDEDIMKVTRLNQNHSSRNSNLPKQARNPAGFDSYDKRGSRKSTYNRREEESDDEDEEHLMNKNRSKAHKRARDLAGKFILIEEESDEDSDEEYSARVCNQPKNRSSHHSSKRTRARDEADEDGIADELHHHQAKRKKRLDPLANDLITAGIIARPGNPYFATRIRKHRWDEMYIPVEFVRTYKINLPEVIVLRDPAGRKWTAKYGTWADSRRFYKGGWRELCRMNLISEDDLCICEFLRSRQKHLYIQVQVIRSTEIA